MKKKTLNICFITEDFYPNFIGGQGIYGYYLIKGLTKEKVNLTVLAEEKWGRKSFWENVGNGRDRSLRVILVPFCFGNQLILALLEYAYFRLKLSHELFDILHTNQLSGLFFVLFKPKNVRKIIVSAQNTYYDRYNSETSLAQQVVYLFLSFIERLIYQKSAAIIYNSDSIKNDLSNFYNIKNKLGKLIYLGADIDKRLIKKRAKIRAWLRKKLGLEKNSKIVLYIGRLIKRKRVETLIEAMKILNNLKDDSPEISPQVNSSSEESSSLVCLIIGDGPEKKKLMKMSPPNVFFIPAIDNAKLAKYYLGSDVFVLTSVAEGGVSLSVLEAAAYGLPLIVSPSVAGFPIIENKVNGYIVDPHNPKLLAKKIQLAINNYQSMSKQSLKKAKFFTWEKSVKETISFYQAML